MAICASSAGIDMTQDEIIEMAKQAGFFVKDREAYSPSIQEDHEITPFLRTFAKLVAAKALSEQERNFCSRCGKRTKDLTNIHICTPPQD